MITENIIHHKYKSLVNNNNKNMEKVIKSYHSLIKKVMFNFQEFFRI